MSIWFNKSLSLTNIKEFGKETMADHLGMQWVEMDKEMRLQGSKYFSG